MRYGIIGAMPVEIEKIKQNMTVEKETVFHDIHFYEGSCQGRQIVLVTCGVGKVNAAHTTLLLINQFGVDKIINVGVAGGIQDDIQVGDMVLGTSTTAYDVGPSIMRRYFPFVENYEYDAEVIEAAKAACESITDRSWKYVVRPTITGDMFIADPMLKEKLVPLPGGRLHRYGGPGHGTDRPDLRCTDRQPAQHLGYSGQRGRLRGERGLGC